MSIWGATPATVWEFRSARWLSGTRSRNSAGTAPRPSRRRRSFSGRATARSISASSPSTAIRSDANNPGARVIVHPECRFEVAQAADQIGSTEGIIKAVMAGRPGSEWAVGTEIHLVNRLGKELKDRKVIPLDPSVCVCTTMFRITPQHLLWVLENLGEGKIVNQISVDEQTRHYATRRRSIG